MYGYLLNYLVDFHEVWYGGNAILGDLDAIIYLHSFYNFKMVEVQISNEVKID
jgi:hypothetical protein